MFSDLARLRMLQQAMEYQRAHHYCGYNYILSTTSKTNKAKSWIAGPRTLSEKAHLTRGQTYLSQVEMVPEVHTGMGFK